MNSTVTFLCSGLCHSSGSWIPAYLPSISPHPMPRRRRRPSSSGRYASGRSCFVICFLCFLVFPSRVSQPVNNCLVPLDHSSSAVCSPATFLPARPPNPGAAPACPCHPPLPLYLLCFQQPFYLLLQLFPSSPTINLPNPTLPPVSGSRVWVHPCNTETPVKISSRYF